jgi:geranylgeranyl pyrophosphate synthase
MNQLAEYLAQQRPVIESALRHHQPQSSIRDAASLNEAISYALFPGGQRWRPFFTILGARLAGQADGTRDGDLLGVACAVEFLHTSSLILDDLPAMDDAAQRRGKPSLHLAFGESTAILAALALLNKSYALLGGVECPAVAQRLLREACLCIGIDGMIGGQSADLCGGYAGGATSAEGRNRKTTALTRLMMTGGAILGGAQEEEVNALARFGECVGMAYQVYDDLLDACGWEAASGKPAHQDARFSRPSAVNALSVDGAVELALATIEEGVAALRRIFGEHPALDMIISAAQHLFCDIKRCKPAPVSAIRPASRPVPLTT